MPYKNIEQRRQYNLDWINSRRLKWISEHGPCQVCGSRYNLTVDHVDPKTKLYHVTSLWSLAEGNPKRVAELAKCQVLCESCHKLKSLIEGSYLGRAILTKAQVEEIIGLYSTGKFTQLQIGNMFGVAQKTVSDIVTGSTWGMRYGKFGSG